MTTPKRVGIDIDGCLADFVAGMSTLIADLSGIVLPREEQDFPCCWNFASHYLQREGVAEAEAKQIDKMAWRTIVESPVWWLNLPPLPHAKETLLRLRDASAKGHEVYFITTRTGNNSKRQTEIWLELHGYKRETATVVVSKRKGFIAAGLELDAMVDDYGENLVDVQRMRGTTTKLYLKDAPYNLGDRHRDWEIVANVGEMLTREGI